MSETPLEQAAQCWCDEATKGIEMDTRLAKAFAKRLEAKDKHIAELEDKLLRVAQREDRLMHLAERQQKLLEKKGG